MLPRRLETFMEQPLELSERITFDAAKHFDVIKCKLEWSSLEADVARRVRQHEAEIDVNQVPVTIDKYVTVMSVFDLQEVCYNRVACKSYIRGNRCTKWINLPANDRIKFRCARANLADDISPYDCSVLLVTAKSERDSNSHL